MRIRHSIREFATQPVILWTLLGGKPKWLLLNFGFNDVMRTAPITSSFLRWSYAWMGLRLWSWQLRSGKWRQIRDVDVDANAVAVELEHVEVDDRCWQLMSTTFCRLRSSSESWLDCWVCSFFFVRQRQTTSHRFGNFHCNSERAHLFSLTLPWKVEQFRMVQRLPSFSFTRKFNHSRSEIDTAHLLRLWLRPQNSCCLPPAPFCSPWIHTPLAFH